MMPSNALGVFTRDSDREICKKYAGPYFENMLISYEATQEYLKHPDPRARIGALAMMRDYWRPKGDFACECEQIARDDADLTVRCIAVNCLISCYYGTRDTRIGRWLAKVVRDETSPAIYRRQAYCVLDRKSTRLN